MKYYNAYLYTEDRSFRRGSFQVENNLFTDVCFEEESSGEVDLQGAYVIPGLVDTHIHGAAGADFSDGDLQGLLRMGEYLAREGITSFVPTTMTIPFEQVKRAIRTAKEYEKKEDRTKARLAGIHMEGPFLAKEKKGAQNEAFLQEPDLEAFLECCQLSGGNIRIVDVAPELPGALELIKRITADTNCRVSVGHSSANYEQALEAFRAGSKRVTHVMNAMTPFHHRDPGILGAAFDQKDAVAELICDGYHVHESAVRMVFSLFHGRICLVSDALRCLGQPEGEYELGGQQIFLAEGCARLSDGTLAGAAANLYEGMQKAIAFGIEKEQAIAAATCISADSIGKRDIGRIAPGCYADFLVCDEQIRKKYVYLGGKRIS